MNNNSDIDAYIETLLKCEYIKEEEVKNLCDKAKEILINMTNIVYLSSPITVSININVNQDLRWYSWSILWFVRVV